MFQKHPYHHKCHDGEQDNNYDGPISPARISDGPSFLKRFFMCQVLLHLLVQVL